jgi:ribonuclease Z
LLFLKQQEWATKDCHAESVMIRYRSFLLTAALLLSAPAVLAQGVDSPAMKVTLLGTGNPRPVIERFGPSILVEAGNQKFIFDCGRGCTQRLYQAKVPFSDVTALFVTHLHSDHIVGVPDLWLTGWIMGRKTPLRVWGPTGTQQMMTHLEEAYAFDIHVRRDVDEQLPAQGVVVEPKDIDQGVVYDSGGVKITAFLVDHGLIKPALGYRIDYAGHSVVLSGDTRYSENLIKFAQGTDLLIHEVLAANTYRSLHTALTPRQMQRVMQHHTKTEEAGMVFAKVKPKLAVYSHIVPPDATDLIKDTRKTYSGPVEVGEDLMNIEVGENIEVHRVAH